MFYRKIVYLFKAFWNKSTNLYNADSENGGKNGNLIKPTCSYKLRL